MSRNETNEPVFERYRVTTNEKKISLADIDTRDKSCFPDRDEAEANTADDVREIAELQNRLYAEGKQALLIVLQATDTGGKDSTIRKVLGPINPQGVRVTSFKTPSSTELAHDYLWRIHQAVPPKGMIGIFNRSHYEDVMIVRVHGLAPKDAIERRYDQINDFERYLSENRVTILKSFLHISKDEQKRRLEARLVNPAKHWKFNPDDLKDRARWSEFMEVYEEMIEKTSTSYAPWHVIPADKKWYRNLCVSKLVLDTLKGLKLKFPEPDWDPGSIKID